LFAPSCECYRSPTATREGHYESRNTWAGSVRVARKAGKRQAAIAVIVIKRELGLRMALGAGASNPLGLVIARGLSLTAGGIVFGIVAGLALTRFLGKLLYNVSPHDPLAFGLALGVLCATA
jgi:hypothetical protein